MLEKVQESLLTVGNVGNEGVEDKGPGQRIGKRFPYLVHLEVLVADTLLITSNALYRKHSVFFRQPSSIHLTVWYRE